MKFIHTADWQIGRQYGFKAADDSPDPSAAMQQARFDAVARIAALATAEQVDVVLVAGDVFDKQGLSDVSLRRVIHAMEGFTGRWILLPGNHDAALAESVWSRLQRLDVVPSNVSILSTPHVIEYAELGFAVLPAPLTQRQTHTDLSDWFDTAQTAPGLLRIGLAHGSVAGILPESADSANPIAPDRAATARLDYLALGDWHGTKRVDDRTWYSGTPEQDRFKDNDSGNVLIVEITGPGSVPQVTSQRVGRFRWQEPGVEINGAPDILQFAADLQVLDSDCVVRCHVGGMIDLAGNGQLRQVIEAAQARAHVLEVDTANLRLEPSEADVQAMRIDGVVAELVDELRTLQDDPDQAATANEALKLLFDQLQQQGAGA